MAKKTQDTVTISVEFSEEDMADLEQQADELGYATTEDLIEARFRKICPSVELIRE